MERLCGHEEDEGGEHVHHHGHGGVCQAGDAQQGAQLAQCRADHQADADAAEEEHEEGDAGVCRREGAGDGRRDGELEADDTGGVVDEGLAREQGLLPRGELDVLAQRHDGGCVCGAQRRAQGEGGGQRDARLHQVEGEARRQRGHQHKAHRKRDDRGFVAPQCELVHVLGFVVEQGGDEEEQEELWVELYVSQLGRCHGKAHAQGDLHQRQAEQRQHLVEQRRDEHGDQQEDD